MDDSQDEEERKEDQPPVDKESGQPLTAWDAAPLVAKEEG